MAKRHLLCAALVAAWGAAAQAGPLAYVPNEKSATLSVIDTSTDARQADIPAAHLSHKDFADREAFDAALMNRIDTHHPDLVVMAGFMRILTPGFVQHYAGRLINIHPSLLPKYPGLNTHARAIEAKDAEHGATVHFVTEGVDEGPAILQGRVPVLLSDTPETLQQRVHEIEHKIYPQAVRMFCATHHAEMAGA